MLRHSGSIYSMLELYQHTKNKKLFDKSILAIYYLIQNIKFTHENKFACVLDKDFIKLGGNALAILALTKYTEVSKDSSHLDLAKKLARWILNTQKENGEFAIHKQSFTTKKIEEFTSDYYPGEAIFSLCRLYVLDPDEHWLNAAERAADFIINFRDRKVKENDLNHDHWLLYALNALHRLRPKQVYIDHSFKISRAIMKAQSVRPKHHDLIGSFYNPARSTPTAIKMEGLCAAYHLANDYGYTQESDEFLKSIKLCASFQLRTQFTPESAFYLKNPHMALGGFRKSLTDYEIRIDYVQHNISALLALYKILSQKEKSTLPHQNGTTFKKNKEINRPKKIEILFAGDTSFGENYQEKRKINILEKYDYNYPLVNMHKILTKSNLVIVNLETPITNSPKSPFKDIKTYVHWTDVDKSPKALLDHNINVVSLANNHMIDYGMEDFNQTLEVLSKNKIDYFAAGNNLEAAAKPYLINTKIGSEELLIAVIGAFQFSNAFQEKYAAYANASDPGMNPLLKESIEQKIHDIKKLSQNALILLFPHWGPNYKWKTDSQTKLADEFLDLGVDLIVGHGAHMLQEIEKRKDRWVVFSLGNFMFNSHGRYKKLRAPPFSLVSKLIVCANTVSLRLYPIVTDNMLTNYQTRFVSIKEFNEVCALLENKNTSRQTFFNTIKRDQDEYGYFLELPIK